jgi:hypothetical protein
MPFKLQPVLVKKIYLQLNNEQDPDEDTWIEARQATQAEQERRQELTAESTREYVGDSQTVRVTQRWSIEEQRKLEVYLTLAGCNILDENDKPLFVFRTVDGKKRLDCSLDAFGEIWGKLPSAIALRIHEAVLEVNPQWNPNLT